MIDGQRIPVSSRFVLIDAARRELSFAVEGYRPDHELIIDPGIRYSTLLGGSSDDLAGGIQVDQAGNASSSAPRSRPTSGRPRARSGGPAPPATSRTVSATKLNAAGTGLVYSTFLGGSNFDWGRAIAIDTAGNAYITGQTKSSNFPTTGGGVRLHVQRRYLPALRYRSGRRVRRQAESQPARLWSTRRSSAASTSTMVWGLPWTGPATPTWRARPARSTSRPVPVRSFDTTRNGEYDVFVTKFNPTGSALVYSTFLGGSLVDWPSRIAVSAGGDAFVVGSTRSADFPTTAGAFDRTANGEFDAFVTRLNAAGSALVYSTFLGGSGFDSASGLTVDATAAPTSPAAQDRWTSPRLQVRST